MPHTKTPDLEAELRARDERIVALEQELAQAERRGFAEATKAHAETKQILDAAVEERVQSPARRERKAGRSQTVAASLGLPDEKARAVAGLLDGLDDVGFATLLKNIGPAGGRFVQQALAPKAEEPKGPDPKVVAEVAAYLSRR